MCVRARRSSLENMRALEYMHCAEKKLATELKMPANYLRVKIFSLMLKTQEKIKLIINLFLKKSTV